MTFTSELEFWIRQQYYKIDLSRSEQFIGKVKFRKMLCELHSESNTPIKQAVNQWAIFFYDMSIFANRSTIL